MFAQQDKLDRENLIAAAKALGLDPKRFEKDLDDPKTLKRVDDEIAVANQNGLTGTPSFLINGVSVIGAVPESEFSTVIDKALELSK
jgi:predicted DsbA family dithiol-disulfide isomerase